MSKNRTVLVLLLLIIVLVAGAIFFVRGRLDSAVARQIEEYGSRMTGTEVSVGSVDLHLREGRATITDLEVANPEGFSDRNAFVLERLVVDIELRSITRQPYVLQDVTVEGPAALYEVNRVGQRNIDVIRERLESYQAGPAEPEAEPLPTMVIERFAFSGGRIEVDPEAVGLEARAVDLPAFELSGLGAPDGAPADAVARQAMTRWARQVVEAAVGGEIRNRLRDWIGGGGG